jgi:hypothetical protein
MRTMTRNVELGTIRRGMLAIGVALAGFGLGLSGTEAARRPAQNDTWRILVAAMPDTVGVAGYACSGCDRNFTGADDMAAASKPLQPLQVVVHKLGDRGMVYWHGTIRRDRAGNQALTEQIALTAPPPYQVQLVTVKPLGYTLCPNSRAGVVLRQSDFDAEGNRSPGAGRSVHVGWYFWSCRPARGD